jgi:LemA protein|tara:strand:- start:702 stop:1289 length:588 start_codon:yes stop_codon:yes gene_type:complete
MNTSVLKWLIPVALLVFMGMNAMGSYNGFVNSEEGVDGQWANVEAQYQRRFDLIPNLVSTVQAYADIEKETLIAVTQARASALGAMQNAGETGDLGEFEKSNVVLGGAMRGLLGYSEQYPDLKSSEGFRDLQVQLEGTENRITKARTDYNEVVKSYNKNVRKFPGKVWANMFDFIPKDYFESTAAAAEAPEVKFD